MVDTSWNSQRMGGITIFWRLKLFSPLQVVDQSGIHQDQQRAEEDGLNMPLPFYHAFGSLRQWLFQAFRLIPAAGTCCSWGND